MKRRNDKWPTIEGQWQIATGNARGDSVRLRANASITYKGMDREDIFIVGTDGVVRSWESKIARFGAVG